MKLLKLFILIISIFFFVNSKKKNKRKTKSKKIYNPDFGTPEAQCVWGQGRVKCLVGPRKDELKAKVFKCFYQTDHISCQIEVE